MLLPTKHREENLTTGYPFFFYHHSLKNHQKFNMLFLKIYVYVYRIKFEKAWTLIFDIMMITKGRSVFKLQSNSR